MTEIEEVFGLAAGRAGDRHEKQAADVGWPGAIEAGAVTLPLASRVGGARKLYCSNAPVGDQDFGAVAADRDAVRQVADGDLLDDRVGGGAMTARLLSPLQATYRYLPSGLSAEPAGKVEPVAAGAAEPPPPLLPLFSGKSPPLKCGVGGVRLWRSWWTGSRSA